jgi:hypothetical protein
VIVVDIDLLSRIDAYTEARTLPTDPSGTLTVEDAVCADISTGSSAIGGLIGGLAAGPVGGFIGGLLGGTAGGLACAQAFEVSGA